MILSFTYVDISVPTDVKATVTTSDRVEVTWSPSSSSDVTGYLISYTTNASNVDNDDRSRSTTVNTTNGTLSNLEEDTLYTITVQATTSDNRMSANSDEVSVRTYTDCKCCIISCQGMSCYNSTVPSSPPLNVMVESNNQTSLNVSWQSPLEIDRNGPITGYVINYTRDESSDHVMIVNVTGTAYTISGLVTFAEYSVRVAAVNINGTGPLSVAVTGKPGGDGKFCTYRILPVNSHASDSHRTRIVSHIVQG